MNDIGINTEYIQTSKQNKTPLGLNISVNNDRAMLTVLGVLEEITINIITEEIINKARHWHIAGYFLLDNLIPAWPEFLKRIKQKGITCSLDTNWAPNGNWEQVIELFPFIDVFLPNENEAIAITGKSNYQEAGKELSQQIPFVVIKRGADGASVFKKEKKSRFS